MEQIRLTSDPFRRLCEEKLNQLFHGHVPETVKQRCEEELSFIESRPDLKEDLNILYRLSQTAERSRQFISLQGPQASSYILWLLGMTRINPLQTHYYCPLCGHYEDAEKSEEIRGEKECPVCGHAMAPGGYNLPLESFTGLNHDNILNLRCRISSAFLPFAKRTLQELYPGHNIVSAGTLSIAEGRLPQLKPSGLVILPRGCAMEDYPQARGVLEDGTSCLVTDFMESPEFIIKYEDDEPDRLNWKTVLLIPDKIADMVLALEQKTGLFMDDIPKNQLRKVCWQQVAATACSSEKEAYLLAAVEPAGFLERLEVHAQCSCTIVHESGEDKTSDILAQLEVHTIAKAVQWPGFTMEDYFDNMVSCGMKRQEAFRRANDFTSFGTQSAPYSIFPPSRRDIAEEVMLQTLLAYYAMTDGQAYSQVTRECMKG